MGFRADFKLYAVELNLALEILIENGKSLLMPWPQRLTVERLTPGTQPDNNISRLRAGIGDDLAKMPVVARPKLNLNENLAASVVSRFNVDRKIVNPDLPTHELYWKADLSR